MTAKAATTAARDDHFMPAGCSAATEGAFGFVYTESQSQMVAVGTRIAPRRPVNVVSIAAMRATHAAAA